MIDFDLPGAFGWRDLVLSLAALLGVYLLVSVIRLLRVGGKRADAAPREGRRSLFAWVRPAPPAAGPTPPGQTPPVPETEFAQQLALSRLEVEVHSLRRETVWLREQLACLAEELARLKATRNVSPLYDEATALAQQGMPAAGIAGRCGISIGEAELVAALARGETAFELEHEGGDRDGRNFDAARHG